MKFYETTFDDYLTEHNRIDFHPELTENFHRKLPETKENMGHLIFYGPSGTGKYTQALKTIKKYSPSELKYEKKLFLNSDKYNYAYKISDIHYEIDFAVLGCNAKLIWHELFLQIVDIISMSNIKYGIILCKNFHTIHTELLPIFYSYMQQYNNSFLPFQIRYILISEQVSFIPNNVMNLVKTLNVKCPNDDIYYDYLKVSRDIDKSLLLNLKDSKLLNLIKEGQEVPVDIFDIICGEIKQKMDNFKKTTLSEFREQIYDILVYNLDFVEVLWEILSQYVQEDVIKSSDLEQIIEPIYGQIKQYNNNYRPIYHLENILLNIVKIKDGY
jgi:DNA polymerase III delta prime subunit